jgi:plastocyanin
MKLRWAIPAAAAVALLMSSVTLAGRTSTHRVAGAQTFTVNVDGHPAGANESFLAYFPHSITVHAGDTVTFHSVGVGEPHTVTLGTLANNAVLTYRHLTPAQQQANTPPPEMLAADAALPNLFPQGPGDATQSAANPCYMPSGNPGTNLCPRSQFEQPVFDGTQSYYNSGWLNSGQKWSIQLSSTTSVGTYRFMCLLHREEMGGKITVAPASKTIMSPSEQYALGVNQLAKAAKPLEPALAALRQGQPPIPNLKLPGENPVLAGSGAPNSNGSIDEFGLKTEKIPVGGSVTWWIIGPHSITFNSDKTNNDIRAVAPDGTVHFNPPALTPAGGPGEPPPSNGGPKSGIHFKLVASSTWNGSGFHSSGVFQNSFGPPVIEGYKLTFTKAGTYHYICTVHDNMKGTVVVGGG